MSSIPINLYIQLTKKRRRVDDAPRGRRLETREPFWRRLWGLPAAWRQAVLIALALLGLLALYAIGRLTADIPAAYSSPEDHFKYGSTGGERSSGIPEALWKTLPVTFPEYLPPGRHRKGREYEAFGFLYEEGKDLPIGVSRRNVMGLPRVFLNCAICHVGSVRFRKEGPRLLVPGMPSNTVDLEAFQRFLFAAAADEKFEPDRMLAEIAAVAPLDWINRVALRYYGIFFMRQRLLILKHRFRYMDAEPDFGPGRVDTFTPAKVLLNFPLDLIPRSELGGTADFPSVWLQRKRKGMHLHWDGNNDTVEERNRSAAFGTGAFPPTLDRASVKRTEDWLLDKEPPRYPEPIDEARAARGRPLYETYCASCHGRDGRDFAGARVGEVTPWEEVGTDRRRLDSYSFELSIAQGSLYAGYDDERFSHFRKTFGYANMPLDGLWLRAPYLHNGSVPTLRDLLEPGPSRPRVFYRGYDLYDPVRVGFVSEEKYFDDEGRSRLEPGDPRRYFRFAVACDPRRDHCDKYEIQCGPKTAPMVCGNGNEGHEYGTRLSPADKDAVVEYLKTF